METKFRYVVWLISLYFGWIIAFPYYGVFFVTYEGTGIPPSYYVYAFLLLHALGYLLGALFLKYIPVSWRLLMQLSLITTIAANLLLWILEVEFWLIGFSLLGFFSSFYVLGWAYLYKIFSSPEKVYIIVHMAIRSNLIAVAVIMLSSIIPLSVLQIVIMLPLLVAGWLIKSINLNRELLTELVYEKSDVFPRLAMFLFCILIAAYKICAGFMYTVIYNSYAVIDYHQTISAYYGYAPYLLAYILILALSDKWQRHHLAITGISFLGLSFVSFALFDLSLPVFLLTIALIESAFALLNVFAWTLLGDLSSTYGSSYRFFGFGLFTVIIGTLIGSITGDYLLATAHFPRSATALYATAAIMLTLFIIPWLKENVEDKINGLFPAQDFYKFLPGPIRDQLFAEMELSKREREVAGLLLQGYTNKLISEKLFISENTVKTHKRNIYKKFGVSKKSDFIKSVSEKTGDKR